MDYFLFGKPRLKDENKLTKCLHKSVVAVTFILKNKEINGSGVL